MSADEEKAIGELKAVYSGAVQAGEVRIAEMIKGGIDLIEKQQAEIKKKDKIIYEMAERLVEDTDWYFSEFDNYTKKDFIEYFTNKVEGETNEI